MLTAPVVGELIVKKTRSAFIALIFIFITTTTFAGPIEDCKEYSVLGIPGKQGEMLCREGFLLAHSAEHKTPLWVIEHLTADKANGNIRRHDKFQPDPDLQQGAGAELSDYRGSGFDWGHMAPAADMKWDQQAMVECFYLSNMVPQVGKGMNQGIWKDLEEYARTWKAVVAERTPISCFSISSAAGFCSSLRFPLNLSGHIPRSLLRVDLYEMLFM